MFCEWPKYRQFYRWLCVSLKERILAIAYINVMLTLCKAAEYVPLIAMLELDRVGVMFRYVIDGMPVFCIIITLSLDVIFTTILIYGVHMKQTAYMKSYYYFMIFVMFESTVLEISNLFQSYSDQEHRDESHILYFVFCFMSNFYILSMVRRLIASEDKFDNKSSNQSLISSPPMYDISRSTKVL
ncbi:uncharacterized protein LOC128680330 [Plodia interpunctella]|uniref:uncharacterized protein LOC128680330 n=1 Tax=Plodia interpunctella TaxID=58824 RepID=UPI0023683D7A|nr:uncharacterized protein LOC128680330 isoform X2 [Plodia interpunctella]